MQLLWAKGLDYESYWTRIICVLVVRSRTLCQLDGASVRGRGTSRISLCAPYFRFSKGTLEFGYALWVTQALRFEQSLSW